MEHLAAQLAAIPGVVAVTLGGLLLSWNHGTWSRLRSTSPGLGARLTGVSAGPAGVPWAVGY